MKAASYKSIDPAVAPLDTVASRLLERYADTPLKLAEAIILVANRRAARSMQESFLRLMPGRAALLPTIQPLGDIGEPFLLRHATLSAEQLQRLFDLPDAINPYERAFRLAEMVWRFQGGAGRLLAVKQQALELACTLGEFLDELHRERCPWERFDTLVPEDYNEHWQRVTAFFTLLRHHWPKQLAERGKSDPWARRDVLLSMLATSWKAIPPSCPVIAIDPAGSSPGMRDVLATVAHLPDGQVYLPGLDIGMSDSVREVVSDTHPDAGALRTLTAVKVPLSRVEEAEPGNRPERVRWLRLAMLPAERSDRWRHEPLNWQAAMADTRVIRCRTQREEAGVIATLMREILEQPGKTAALVTESRTLAQRVQSQLRRWDIEVNDSAGIPLSNTPPGVFLRLIAQAIEQEFAPVALLALLKHPLMRIGREAGMIRPLVRRLETQCLRGITPVSFSATCAACAEDDELAELLRCLTDACRELTDFARQRDAQFADWITAHNTAAEILSRLPDGSSAIWQREEGEALAEFLADVKEAATDLPLPYDAKGYFAALQLLMKRENFRLPYGTHPRLQILGPIEARLQRYDRMILADLNEGGWPATPPVDAWLNRPMRAALGLPSPDERTGQAAHDFMQLAAAREVFFTRSEKVDGVPSVPSRYLLRLEAVLRLHGGDKAVARWYDTSLPGIVRAMHQAPGQRPVPRPEPRPPVAIRPRRMSATEIERLQIDPYAVYAKRILGLKALDKLEELPGAKDFGMAAHAAMERFVRERAWIHDDPLASMLAYGREALRPLRHLLVVDSLWWPRFRSIAEWAIPQISPSTESVEEQRAKWEFATPAGPFTVTAQPDRIYRDAKGLHVIDYKTGTPPSNEKVAKGLAGQLQIAAVMAQRGCFGDQFRDAAIGSLTYWLLSGGDKQGKIHEVKVSRQSLQSLLDETASGLPQMLAAYDDPQTAYPAQPDWKLKPRYSDYEHLARTREWMLD